MTTEIFICQCHSHCHQASFWYDEDENMLYVTIHLIHKSFWKRLKAGVKYIFGFTSNYGDWDEFLFKGEDAEKLKSFLDKKELTTPIINT